MHKLKVYPKMTKRIFIRQPVYLPGLVFFDAIHRVDTYVIFDDVQYERRHWGNRNKILTPKGSIWLTVPVLQKGNFDQTYQETKIDNTSSWGKIHWKSISLNYAKAPYFKEYANFFESLYQKRWDDLIRLNYELITFLKTQLGIKTEIKLSSSLNVPKLTQYNVNFNYKNRLKNDKLINIVKILNGTTYLSSKAATNYIDEDYFKQNNIELKWHEFNHPVYPQFRGGNFVLNMSVIDLLFNCGPKSKKLFNLKN